MNVFGASSSFFGGYYAFCEESRGHNFGPLLWSRISDFSRPWHADSPKGPFVYICQRETTNKVVSLEEPPFIHKFYVHKTER